MIDYLEDLLEEETAVELTGTLLAPAGRRRVPLWEEEEEPAWERQGEGPEEGAERPPPEEENAPWRAGSSSWAEGQEASKRGGAALLLALVRTARAAQQVTDTGRVLAVDLPEGRAQAGGLDLEHLDRAVQRDARRYDGGFPLY